LSSSVWSSSLSTSSENSDKVPVVVLGVVSGVVVLVDTIFTGVDVVGRGVVVAFSGAAASVIAAFMVVVSCTTMATISLVSVTSCVVVVVVVVVVALVVVVASVVVSAFVVVVLGLTLIFSIGALVDGFIVGFTLVDVENAINGVTIKTFLEVVTCAGCWLVEGAGLLVD